MLDMAGLADVIPVLLEPPDHGRAVLHRNIEGSLTSYQVAWRTERPMRPGAWYVRAHDGSRAHSTSTFDGSVHRHFSGLRLVEQHKGRPEYWHPALHPLLPIKGYFWGRTGDDWRLHDDVSTDGALASVRLSRVDGGQSAGRLVVDMARGLVVSYERPGDVLTLVDIRSHLLLDVRLDEVQRRVTDSAWLGPEPIGSPGVIRFAG